MSAVASLVEALRSEALRAEMPRSEMAADDRNAWSRLRASPEAVVHPTTTEGVAATMRLASEHGVGVVVVASGARLRASREVDDPFLVLCTDRLSGIETYEPADLTLTAKAGTSVRTLAAELHANGQWLPYDPPHVDRRSLGGLVATGESGPLWMGYGELRNHVLGLTLVTGDGRTLELGGRVVKNVAGFDLLKPVVGSRGRFGVVTSACVRAFPEPACERVLVLRAQSANALLPAARAIGTASVMPVSSVLVTGLGGQRGARLLVRLHGAETTVEADRRTLERHAGVTFELAPDAGELLSTARDHAAGGDLVLGISVLPSKLPEAFAALGELLDERAVHADTYRGSVLVSAREDDVPRVGRLRARMEALGGTLGVRAAPGSDASGLASSVPAPAAALTKSLEQVFDPKGVLWPSRL
jgi:glycolate oxidase FAD binding subunit